MLAENRINGYLLGGFLSLRGPERLPGFLLGQFGCLVSLLIVLLCDLSFEQNTIASATVHQV